MRSVDVEPKIREYRERVGLSQGELVEKAPLRRPWVAGGFRNPFPAEIRFMCQGMAGFERPDHQEVLSRNPTNAELECGSCGLDVQRCPRVAKHVDANTTVALRLRQRTKEVAHRSEADGGAVLGGAWAVFAKEDAVIEANRFRGPRFHKVAVQP